MLKVILVLKSKENGKNFGFGFTFKDSKEKEEFFRTEIMNDYLIEDYIQKYKR